MFFWLCAKCGSFVGMSLRTCRKCKRRRPDKWDAELLAKLSRLSVRARRLRQSLKVREDDD